MKIQNLAVMFIIIILPISLILTAYVQNQVKTIELQMSYDSKLITATHDAVTAFQLNTVNSSTSDVADSKIRDIQASVNSFFNSVATQFNLSGYDQGTLKSYVPALVYIMYDGYYIYSPFTNTLEAEDEGETYKNGDKVYNLKPYVHYSCRYVKSGVDVVITYSLDNYISIKGTVDGVTVDRDGYLLDNVTTSGNDVSYYGVNIPTETLTENFAVYQNNNDQVADISTYTYTRANGVKYYKEGSTWFSMLNDQKISQSMQYSEQNNSAQRYYKEAKEFTEWIRGSSLKDLTSTDARDENGNTITDTDLFSTSYKIFDGISGTSPNSVSIEDPKSNFNQHRQAVIRYSIEKNLSIAIANYNTYSSATSANFQMPELSEEEWEKIINNVSVISFLQGLSIGGKVYNGYAIVTNTKTEEVVNTDSIYIIYNGEYYRATDTSLVGKNVGQGYLNTDFERKSLQGTNGITYFYPHNEMGSYTSIVTQSGAQDLTAYNGSIYKYMASIANNGNVAQKYFTALGRERASMYRTDNNNEEELQKVQ